MRTFRDAKAMAKSLRSEIFDRRQLDLSHGECLEIVARQFGMESWNVLAARIEHGSDPQAATVHNPAPHGGTNTTIPVLKVFSEAKARQFYLDFLGFTLDFGGPAEGEGTPFYGQISRLGTTIHLAEHEYDPCPGATVIVWVSGLNELHHELDEKKDRVRVWGPAVWLPAIEELPWSARSLTLPDPFGNVVRFYEPTDRRAHPYLPRDLPRWAGAPPAAR